MLLAGRVGRPHGLDGSFHLVDVTPNLAVASARARVGDLDATVIEVKGTAEKPIVRLDVASDRDAIEALRGSEVLLDAEAPELGEDEYPAAALEGCRVVDGERSLGVVVKLLGLPSCEVLELDTGLLVPMVRDAVRSIDVDAKVIEVDAGFLGAA